MPGIGAPGTEHGRASRCLHRQSSGPWNAQRAAWPSTCTQIRRATGLRPAHALPMAPPLPPTHRSCGGPRDLRLRPGATVSQRHSTETSSHEVHLFTFRPPVIKLRLQNGRVGKDRQGGALQLETAELHESPVMLLYFTGKYRHIENYSKATGIPSFLQGSSL